MPDHADREEEQREEEPRAVAIKYDAKSDRAPRVTAKAVPLLLTAFWRRHAKTAYQSIRTNRSSIC